MMWPCKSITLSGILNLSLTELKSAQSGCAPSSSLNLSLSLAANLSLIEGPGDSRRGNSTLSILLKPIWCGMYVSAPVVNISSLFLNPSSSLEPLQLPESDSLDIWKSIYVMRQILERDTKILNTGDWQE